MAITDAGLTFDLATTLTVTTVSAQTLDLSVVRDIGATDRPLRLLFLFTTLPTAGGAATVQIQIQTSADNATWSTLEQTDVLPITVFTGSEPTGGINIALPGGVKRYLRCNYIVGTGPLTGGVVFSGLVEMRKSGPTYARNYVA